MLSVVGVVRLKLKVGQMAPTPAIASALGQRGVNIMKFLQTFNSLVAQHKPDCVVIVLAQIYQNKSFDIIIKGRPSADLLKEACGLSKGSSEPGKVNGGVLTMEQLMDIAQIKAQTVHNKCMKGVIRMLIGTAHSIGINILNNDG